MLLFSSETYWFELTFLLHLFLATLSAGSILDYNILHHIHNSACCFRSTHINVYFCTSCEQGLAIISRHISVLLTSVNMSSVKSLLKTFFKNLKVSYLIDTRSHIYSIFVLGLQHQHRLPINFNTGPNMYVRSAECVNLFSFV